MKKCPNCQNTYGDENLYCLNDGSLLTEEPAPTVAFNLPGSAPANTPFVVDLSAKDETPTVIHNYEPVSRAENDLPKNASKNYLIFLLIGLLCGGGLVLLTVFIMNSSKTNQGVDVNNSSNANQAALARTPVSNAQTNAALPKNRANQNSNQRNSVTIQNTKNDSLDMSQNCRLDDGGRGYGQVNVRIDCDTLDCENDASTVSGSYPNDTPVRLISGKSGVQTPNFKWLAVRLTDEKRDVWVSSTKLVCE